MSTHLVSKAQPLSLGVRPEPFTLGVSLVLYRNDPEQVRAVLRSVQATPCDTRICAVDNSPSPALHDVIKPFGAHYVHDPSNPGFGASHNRAFHELPSSDFHLVVNPDIYFPPENLMQLLGFLQKEESAGLVSPRILFPSGEQQYLCKRFPSLLVLFARRFLPKRLEFLIRARMDRYEMRDVGYDHVMDVPYMTGCFMLFRREAYERVEGFDPKFFLYLEDADISFRVARSGFRVLYYPEAHVFHHWGRGSHKSWRLTWASIRSSFYFFSKHGWKFL
jgi:GT2 family glycosyltransferase